jgi:hypothetical protein
LLAATLPQCPVSQFEILATVPAKEESKVGGRVEVHARLGKKDSTSKITKAKRARGMTQVWNACLASAKMSLNPSPTKKKTREKLEPQLSEAV